jgi:hypothetical protein
MQPYRCFFVDALNAITGRVEFEAAGHDDAVSRADTALNVYVRATGYSLWVDGRLVVERAAVVPRVQLLGMKR